MIEKPTLKTSVYLYLSFIEKNFSKIPTLLCSIQVAHFLKLYILMSQNLFEGFPQAQFPSQMVNILKGRGIDGTFTSFFLIIPVSISIILFLLAYGIMVLHPKKYQLDNHGRWNHVLKSTSSVLIFLSNFFIITFICMMIEFFHSKGFTNYPYFILFVIPITGFVALIAFLSSRTWIFSGFFPFVVLVLDETSSSPETVIGVACLSIFFLLKEKTIILQIIYQLLFISSLLELLRVFLGYPIHEIDFLLILSIFLFVILANVLSRNFKFSGSRLIDNRFIIQTYEKVKIFGKSQLSDEILFELEKMFISSQPESETFIDSMKENLFHKMSEEQLYLHILQKLQKDQKQSPSFQMDALCLEFKLVAEKDIISTMMQIRKFIIDEKKRNRSFWHEYEILKLKLKVKDYYFSKNLNHLETFEIMELSKISMEFLQIALDGFKNLENFWSKMKAGVDQQLMEKEFSQALSGKKKMKKILEQLKKKYAAKNQKKVMEIYESIFTPYYEPDFILPITDFEIKYNSLNYLITRNEFIETISFQLLHDLGREEFQPNQTLRSLLPPKIMNYIQQQQPEKIQAKNSSIFMPLVTFSELIILKKCKISLLPSIDFGVQYFYYFQDIKNDNDCYFLIKYHNFLISNISNDIAEKFEVEDKYIIEKLKNEAINIRDIVDCTDFDQEMFTFQKEDQLKCFLDLSIFKCKQGKVEGYLSLIEEFGKDYMLVGFKRAGVVSQTRLSVLNQSMMKARNYQKDARSQTFFCKIPNPFRQKIEQKNREIEEGQKFFSKSRIICMLFFLQFILLLLLAGSYFLYIQNENSTLNEINKKIKISDNQNYEMIKAFESVYEQYLIYEHFEEIKAYLQISNSSYSLEDILSEVREKIHDSLHQFHKNFVSYLYRPYFDTPYELKFQDFNIQANFKSNNLVDFSYNLKLASEKIADQWKIAEEEGIPFNSTHESPNVLDFIFTNYEVFKSLETNFKSIEMFLEEKEEMKIQNIIIIIVVLGSTIVLTLIIYVLLIRINNIFKAAVGIFYKIDKTSFDLVTDDLKKKKLGIKILENFQNTLQEEMEDSEQINYQQRLYEKEVAENIENQALGGSEMNLDQKEKLAEKRRVRDQNITVPKTSFLFIVTQNKFYFFYFCFLLLASYIYYNRIDLHQKEITVYLKYISSINQYENRYLYLSTNLFQSVLSQKLSAEPFDLIPEVIEKKIFINLELSDYFKEFKDRQMAFMRQDLCQEDETGLPKLFEKVSCSEVYHGILTRGFSQSEAIFENEVYKLMSGQDQLFGASGSEMPYFIQHLYTRLKLVRHLEIVEERLTEALEKFVTGLEMEGMIFFFVVASVAFSMLISFLLYEIKRLRMNSEHSKGFFQIVPRIFMEKMDVVSYIREADLLAGLAQI